MSILEAILLGIVQGLTEFLPVSSSGHMLLVPFVLGLDQPSLAFIVAAHIGTLGAVIWVLWDRVLPLIKTVLAWPRALEADRRTVKMLIIGSIPAAAVGFGLSGLIEGIFERPVVAALLLGSTAWILFSADARRAERRRIDLPDRVEWEMRPADAFIIGCGQALAILPGISRSGATISAGVLRDFAHEHAARFAFLLFIPAMVGATLHQFPAMLREGAGGEAAPMIVGAVVSFAAGVAAIRILLALVERKGLRPFAIYCSFAMVAGLLTALARG